MGSETGVAPLPLSWQILCYRMINASVTYFGAFAAGLLSFFSPCVLPLFPSYATYLNGVPMPKKPGKTSAPKKQWLIFGHALLFVIGFSLVFILLGASATSLGRMFQEYRRTVIILTGSLFIAFGLFLTGVFRPLFMMREYRLIRWSERLPKSLFSLVAGAGFGMAWTPCIGPYLGSILALAAGAGSVKVGVVMLSIYSVGLAIPFLLSAAGMEWVFRMIGRRQKLLDRIQRISGVILIIIGIALVSGVFEQVTQWLIQVFNT